MRHSLQITYPQQHYSIELDRQIEAIVGDERNGSGIGLGSRDMEWIYERAKTSRWLKELRDKLRKALPNIEFEIEYEELDEDE